ncbi:hypothetical protein TOPH_02763 [Tolypocladium ophioglossoides CBS 100239]|uniref:Uncharacterized protein n=1 Tax=Tolypocladium ophioglossoides (strain CBS 100239) TaxID=1163406 RepID=A0A0L0NFD8_TOLOC|nr:hypothetical protein TOPH_02763 [Tolypocladium ophioglossoides CBS 100239]
MLPLRGFTRACSFLRTEYMTQHGMQQQQQHSCSRFMPVPSGCTEWLSAPRGLTRASSGSASMEAHDALDCLELGPNENQVTVSPCRIPARNSHDFDEPADARADHRRQTDGLVTAPAAACIPSLPLQAWILSPTIKPYWPKLVSWQAGSSFHPMMAVDASQQMTLPTAAAYHCHEGHATTPPNCSQPIRTSPPLPVTFAIFSLILLLLARPVGRFLLETRSCGGAAALNPPPWLQGERGDLRLVSALRRPLLALHAMSWFPDRISFLVEPRQPERMENAGRCTLLHQERCPHGGRCIEDLPGEAPSGPRQQQAVDEVCWLLYGLTATASFLVAQDPFQTCEQELVWIGFPASPLHLIRCISSVTPPSASFHPPPQHRLSSNTTV